ncbi:urease subunit beta [Mycobacterium sp. NS-7484]|nr:urease subunit beta [Mycobacterium sp. E802]OMB92998.1 urease subunit beta [Mycobacterium sp. NS-7484]
MQPGADSSTKPSAPGAIIFGTDPVLVNVGCEVTTVKVVNTGDRPIHVGSHYHFAETNSALEFDRKAAWGKRQNIISGGLTRFDPGVTQEIELIPYGGRRIAAGFRGECGGPLDA